MSEPINSDIFLSFDSTDIENHGTDFENYETDTETSSMDTQNSENYSTEQDGSAIDRKSDSEDTDCKYCGNPIGNEASFRPCNCQRMKIHHKCLAAWIRHNQNIDRDHDQDQNIRCEICRREYIITYSREFKLFKCCRPTNRQICSTWLSTHGYWFLVIFCAFVVPFIGVNDSHLVEYSYSDGEINCLSKTGNSPNLFLIYNVLSSINIIMVFFASAVMILMMGLIIATLIRFCNIVNAAARRFWELPVSTRSFSLSFAIIIYQLLFYLVGNLGISCGMPPVTFVSQTIANNWDEGQCVQYNQIQQDRYDWLIDTKINIITWTMGLGMVSCFLAMVCFGIVGIALILLIFYGIYCLFRWCYANPSKCGNCCKNCWISLCGCFFMRKMRIQNLNELELDTA